MYDKYCYNCGRKIENLYPTKMIYRDRFIYICGVECYNWMMKIKSRPIVKKGENIKFG